MNKLVRDRIHSRGGTGKLLVGFLGLTLFLSANSARAQERQLPPARQVELLLTCLAYDTDLRTMRNPEVRIGLVVPEADQTHFEAIHQALMAASRKTVQSLPIKVVPLPIHGSSDFEDKVKKANANVLFLAGSLDAWLKPILVLAASHKLLTITGTRALVKSGAAIGAVEKDGQPRILINLQAAIAQGADLDIRLLRASELIR